MNEKTTPTEWPPVEVWRGDRKVTIHSDSVIRVWGLNMETQMTTHPRTHESVRLAMDWLYVNEVHPRGRPVTAKEALDRIECLVAEHGDENCELAKKAIHILKTVMGIYSSLPAEMTEEERNAVEYYQRNPRRAAEALGLAKRVYPARGGMRAPDKNVTDLEDPPCQL